MKSDIEFLKQLKLDVLSFKEKYFDEVYSDPQKNGQIEIKKLKVFIKKVSSEYYLELYK